MNFIFFHPMAGQAENQEKPQLLIDTFLERL